MREQDVFMLMAMDELESKWCLSQDVIMHVQYVRLNNYDLGGICIPPVQSDGAPQAHLIRTVEKCVPTNSIATIVNLT